MGSNTLYRLLLLMTNVAVGCSFISIASLNILEVRYRKQFYTNLKQFSTWIIEVEFIWKECFFALNLHLSENSLYNVVDLIHVMLQCYCVNSCSFIKCLILYEL